MNYQDIKSKLVSAGIATADLEVRIIFEDIAGVSFVDLIIHKIVLTPSSLPDSFAQSIFSMDHPNKSGDDGVRDDGLRDGKKVIVIPPHISDQILSIIDRRVQGESLGRILGYRDFWKSRFYLSPETLEPRPDTETLVEEVLHDHHSPKRILDLGTGTGCILLSLLQEFPDATGVAVDKAQGACEMATENAKRLGLENRATILNGSWFDPLPPDSKFDLIVSNPPYIPSQEIRNLQVEVKNHDPILALDGGEDGLLPYKYLCSNLKRYLEPHGIVVLEFGVGQAYDIGRIVEEAGATLIRVTHDLGGHPRVIKFRYGDN